MSFSDRMQAQADEVYAAIERNEVQDVEAALMDAHLTASTDEEN
ncbi:hypothetical protein GCM10010294_67850 [Streptomyces griseoloalbus]|nr:hypothetical protein GCM10010294_67850 [Streptomyces griseoloalbus]